MTIAEFQNLYPTKEEREDKLKTMNDEEIDEIIISCGIIQAKIYYSKFKNKEATM